MELQLEYIKKQMWYQLFFDGQKTCYRDTEAEIKAKHWIATEIEKLMGLNKSVRIIVEDIEAAADAVERVKEKK